MSNTYRHYILREDLEQLRKSIVIIEIVESYDLGSIVRFTCKDEKVLNQIFGEDDF